MKTQTKIELSTLMISLLPLKLLNWVILFILPLSSFSQIGTFKYILIEPHYSEEKADVSNAVFDIDLYLLRGNSKIKAKEVEKGLFQVVLTYE